MRYVLDTDTLSLFRRGNPHVIARLQATDPGEAGITVITVEEQLTGWYALLRKVRTPPETAAAYERLAKTVTFLGSLPILPFTEAAIARFQRLLNLKLNVGAMDLRIAAIALEAGATVITRNTRDFSRIPDLMIEDWTA